MIYWFTGQPGSGKTTLAKALVDDCSDTCFHIDGDAIRELYNNKEYNKKGRIKNSEQIRDLVKYLDYNNHTVMVSTVSPFKEFRDNLKKETNVTEIYLHTTEIRGKEHFFTDSYQPPTEDFIDIDTTNISIEECLNKIPYNKK